MSGSMPLPEVFAVMLDSSFNGAQETQFKVWDVDWNSNGVGAPARGLRVFRSSNS
jgi:hypothetical protein